MFAVCVTIEVAPGRMDDFLPIMEIQARTSLSQELGCHRFDICQSGDEVFLYELYDDEAAFHAHLATAHFKQFDTAAAGMITGKSAKTYQRLTQG